MAFWHKHRWKVNGAQPMFGTNHYYPEIRKPITEVLLVCSCEQVKTICLDGHWTLEELKPKPTEKEADREFFKKLGVKL